MIASFLDELTKLGQAAPGATLGRPLDSIGTLVRRAMLKKADSLYSIHNEMPPPAIDVRPTEASTRLPEGGKNPPLIRSGYYGTIESSKYPIDRERFNRAWNQPLR